MTLSKPVEESLRESQECLRNALAFSARNEKPYISKHIASFLSDIDNLIDAHNLMEKVQNQLNKYEDDK